MPIRQSKQYKVYEESATADGRGRIVASFRSVDEAEASAARFAAESAPKRYYVLATSTGHYVDSTGGTVRRAYGLT